MARLRDLMLGSAAALSVLASAQAADLPVAKAAPVEYVRVCSTHGQGFFYVPGSDSCLRIAGRVRADYLYAEPVNRFQDITGFRARARINLDSRTATAYGLLRAYVRYEIDRNSGAFASPGQISTNPKIKQAFVQFGGLTAGRVTSFFSDSTLPAPNFGDLRFDDPTNADVDLLAYTYTFGNGFSATLSLEDALERRVSNPLAFPLFGAGATTPAFAPLPFTYGGERMPDVVANLRYAGSWGSVQLSGALHQIRDVGASEPVINPITGLPNPAFAGTDYGFALALSSQVALPALGPDDALWMSATYTDGAVGYINAGQAGPITSGSISAGPMALPFADAFVDPFTGQLKTNKAYGVAGGLNHVWNAAFQTNVFGSWMRFDAPGVASFLVPGTPATIVAGTAGTVTGLVDFNEYRIGTNSIWTPVSGLIFGLEVLYTRVDPRGRFAVPVTNYAGAATGAFKSTGSDNAWEGRLRVQRDF